MSRPGSNWLQDCVPVTSGIPRRWQLQWRASPPTARCRRSHQGPHFTWGPRNRRRDMALAESPRPVVASDESNRAAQRMFRSLIGALAMCLLISPISAAHAAPSPAGVDSDTVQLNVIPDGNGRVLREPVPVGGAECRSSDVVVKQCPYDYARGDQVTLRAEPNVPDVTFVGWSDQRCVGTGPCTLPMDAERQSIAALFSPQRVLVAIAGQGTVNAVPGSTCDAFRPGIVDCGNFPLLSQVVLRATAASPQGPAPIWNPAPCDPPAPEPGEPTCTVSVYSVRYASVGFGQKPGGDVAPSISVHFRVLKNGAGSGTVRSQSLDCGTSCLATARFGQNQTLVADPASDSTFSGWQGACGTAPRCSVAVGPVTALGAVFDKSKTSERPTPASPPPRPARRFVARLTRMAVRGHGRHRNILMRVQVNAPATVKATLSSARRRVTSQRWRVPAGSRLLRLHVPGRARPGVYQLRMSLRPRAGGATQFTRRVRLPR
jgi:hypothetical protein